MNFATYLETVRWRCKPFEPKDQLEHAQIGMISELGELADLVKCAFVYGKEFDPVNLLEECGDWLWYFVLFTDVIQVHIGRIEKSAAETEVSAEANTLTEVQYMRALAGITAALSIHELDEPMTKDLGDALAYGVGMIKALLHKHGFTLEQCLDTNDAKLEKRTGKAFDAAAILGRDVAAERVILEGGANG